MDIIKRVLCITNSEDVDFQVSDFILWCHNNLIYRESTRWWHDGKIVKVVTYNVEIIFTDNPSSNIVNGLSFNKIFGSEEMIPKYLKRRLLTPGDLERRFDNLRDYVLAVEADVKLAPVKLMDKVTKLAPGGVESVTTDNRLIAALLTIACTRADSSYLDETVIKTYRRIYGALEEAGNERKTES